MKGDASQKFVPIKTIRNGLVELDDGSYIKILLTNSLNLSLKGEDEQSAIINQFQNFFNTIDFNIQIFIKSRRANIDAYIKTIEDRVKFIDEELLKLQTIEYISYIKSFTEEVNILEKQFFVVIPYKPAIINQGSGLFGKNESSEQKLLNLNKIEQQIDERVDMVSGGLTRCGLKVKELDTEECIDLYYSLFNPGIESKILI